MIFSFLWADGTEPSTHYQYLGLNTLTNETETLEMNEATEQQAAISPEQRFEERRGLGLTEPFFRAMIFSFQN